MGGGLDIGGTASSNWDSCIAVTKKSWSLQFSFFGVPQASKNKLSTVEKATPEDKDIKFNPPGSNA